MQGLAAFELACSDEPPSFLVDGAWYEMRRPRASAAVHVLNRHDFMSMLAFLDAALTRESASDFRERALHPVTGLGVEQITDVFTYVLGEVSGMPYWVAEHLIYSAAQGWHQFTAHCGGQDPTRLPLDRFLSFVYAWRTRDGDKEGIEKYDAILMKPPPEVKAEVVREQDPAWSKANQAAEFMAQFARSGARRQQPTLPAGDPSEFLPVPLIAVATELAGPAVPTAIADFGPQGDDHDDTHAG